MYRVDLSVSERGLRRQPAREDRVAYAAACRMLAYHYDIDAEDLARQPARYARRGDAAWWRVHGARAYRHHHGTGEAARNAHRRALWSLWRHCLNPERFLGAPRPKLVCRAL